MYRETPLRVGMMMKLATLPRACRASSSAAAGPRGATSYCRPSKGFQVRSTTADIQAMATSSARTRPWWTIGGGQ
jgi:hypothetical protein